MLQAIWAGVKSFAHDLVRDLAPSFGVSDAPEATPEAGASPAPPPDVSLDTGGGGDDGGGGSDTGGGSGGGGGSDTGSFGDTGINWGDTGWGGWSDWDTAYPYVETEDQTCFAQEKYKKPVCYAKGGREQEREVIVQGLKCSTTGTQPLPTAELALVLTVGLLWFRARR
jgi:hypothetical protein